MSDQSAAKERFTKRRGVLLIILAPIVFLLSGLFLFNAVVFSPGSLPYAFGELLCFLVSPSFLISGIAVYAIARKRSPKVLPRPQGELLSAVQPREQVAKAKPAMPQWEWRMRRFYFWLILLVMLSTVASLIMTSGLPGLILFGSLIFLMPIIVCPYLRSSRRGWFGAGLLFILALFTFFGGLPSPIQAVVGTEGVGVTGMYLDWIAGINGVIGGLFVWLAVRAGVILSVSIFLVIARLLQYQRFRRLVEVRAFRGGMAVAVLIPFVLMFVVSPANIATTQPTPIAYAYPGDFELSGDVSLVSATESSTGASQTFRAFDATTGLWTYSIAMSNPTQANVTIVHVWAGHEAVAPLGARVTVGGSGIAVTDAGIVFAPAANGTIKFVTTAAYNVITLGEAGYARYQITWP